MMRWSARWQASRHTAGLRRGLTRQRPLLRLRLHGWLSRRRRCPLRLHGRLSRRRRQIHKALRDAIGGDMVELVAWATLRPQWLATTLPTHVPKLLLALNQLPRRLLSATHEF